MGVDSLLLEIDCIKREADGRLHLAISQELDRVIREARQPILDALIESRDLLCDARREIETLRAANRKLAGVGE